MLFGFAGVCATWDTTPKTFHAGNWSECRDELNWTGAPHDKMRHVRYVLITEDMKGGVGLSPFDQAQPMPPEAIEKFERDPFYPVFQNGEVTIYRIDWSHA